jgi:hypothetical protein
LRIQIIIDERTIASAPHNNARRKGFLLGAKPDVCNALVPVACNYRCFVQIMSAKDRLSEMEEQFLDGVRREEEIKV